MLLTAADSLRPMLYTGKAGMEVSQRSRALRIRSPSAVQQLALSVYMVRPTSAKSPHGINPVRAHPGQPLAQNVLYLTESL